MPGEDIPSVSDSIVAAFDSVGDSDNGTAADAGDASGASASAESATGGAKADAGASDNGEGADKSAKADETENPASSDDKSSKAEKPIDAPASWDADSKAKFAQLPRDLQEYIAKRESERDRHVNQRSEESAKLSKRFEDLDRVLETRRDRIARMGMTEAQVINQLLSLADHADSDFAGFIKEQAQFRGFDLNSLVSADKTKSEEQYTDPVVADLQKQIQTLQNALNGFQNQQVNNSRAEVANQVQAFAEEKDAQGNLVRPHYAKLEAEIEPFILAIRRGNPKLPIPEVMQQAYDRALWANPELRQSLIEQERRTAEQKRISEEQQKSHKAQKTAVSDRGAPYGDRARASDNESVEDTLRNVMSAFGA